MSNLKNLRVYLSGPCENVPDSGGSWREIITPKLKELGLIVFDPVCKNNIKLSFASSNKEEFNYVKHLRDKEDYETLAKCMKEVVHTDLRMTDCADLVIVQLDNLYPTTGTIDEIITAINQQKPVYLCSKQGKKAIPLWLFGRIPLHYIFNDINEILNKLKKIAYCNQDELKNEIDKRWLFSNNLGV